MILALIALLGACSDGNPLAAVGAPYGPFEAPTYYATWWSEVEACSHRTGDFARVDWLRVEDGRDGTFACGRRECAAAWQAPHKIYVARTYVWSEFLIKHEMVHDLTQSANHLQQAFFDCGVLFDH